MSIPALNGTVECNKFLCFNLFDIDRKKMGNRKQDFYSLIKCIRKSHLCIFLVPAVESNTANEDSHAFTRKLKFGPIANLNQQGKAERNSNKDTGMICVYILLKNKHLVSFHPWLYVRSAITQICRAEHFKFVITQKIVATKWMSIFSFENGPHTFHSTALQMGELILTHTVDAYI